MKKSLRLNALLAAALVAVLPSISNANTITFTGNVDIGNTAYHPFDVLTAGELRFSTLNDFVFRLFNSAGGEISGVVFGTFTGTLGVGNYSVGIENYFGLLTNSYGIEIKNTFRSPAVVAAAKVPEPTTITMFGAGLLGLVWLRRRRSSNLV